MLRQLQGAGGPDAPLGPPVEPDDPEEVLRILMVRLWPRVLKGTARPEDRREFLQRVMELRDAAESDDLRFIDAWNNVYEALDRLELGGEPRLRSAAHEFLRSYAGLLQHHCDRL